MLQYCILDGQAKRKSGFGNLRLPGNINNDSSSRTMSANLRQLLWAILVGTIGGIGIAVAIRKLKPNWCKSYNKFCRDRKWWLFLYGSLLFVFLAYRTFSQDNISGGIFYSVFAVLQIWAFFKCGFKLLSPDERQKIDNWDPTKFFKRSPNSKPSG